MIDMRSMAKQRQLTKDFEERNKCGAPECCGFGCDQFETCSTAKDCKRREEFCKKIELQMQSILDDLRSERDGF
jgi:hypothetical protein